MVDFSDSDLIKRLVRDGLRAKPAGTGNADGMKGPVSSQKALNREVVADAEGGGEPHRPLPRSVSPGKLKTRMRKAAGRMTRNRAAFLMLVVDNDR